MQIFQMSRAVFWGYFGNRDCESGLVNPTWPFVFIVSFSELGITFIL